MDKVDYNKIRKIVDAITTNDLKELYQSHKGLNPRDSKSESRKEWIKKYENRQKIIKKWSNWFENNIASIQEKTGLNKAETRKGFAKAFRERQENELQVSSSLINPVKISLLSSVTSYFQNPQKLDEGKPYQPRNKTNNKSDNTPLSNELGNHSSKLLDDMNFEIIVESVNETEMVGEIKNKSIFTLQTVQINLYQNSSKVLISEAIGENFEVGFGSVQIPFIRASMTDTPHRVGFKLKIGGFVNLTDGDLTFVISVENPVERQKEKRTISL